MCSQVTQRAIHHRRRAGNVTYMSTSVALCIPHWSMLLRSTITPVRSSWQARAALADAGCFGMLPGCDWCALCRQFIHGVLTRKNFTIRAHGKKKSPDWKTKIRKTGRLRFVSHSIRWLTLGSCVVIGYATCWASSFVFGARDALKTGPGCGALHASRIWACGDAVRPCSCVLQWAGDFTITSSLISESILCPILSINLSCPYR